jgi:hypothetical protein
MVTEKTAQNGEVDYETAVAEFIRSKGTTRCPTACVLPTQGSVAAADREALEEHAERKAKAATRTQQFWSVEAIPPGQDVCRGHWRGKALISGPIVMWIAVPFDYRPALSDAADRVRSIPYR